MHIKKFTMLLLIAMSLAALLNGCGSSNREGGTLDGVSKVDETLCAQCHGSAVEKLTGRPILADYASSVHALKSVGCQDCHGGGAQHNGKGPIPFPKPNHLQCQPCHDKAGNQVVTKYMGSKHFNILIENQEGKPCQRCHTHQGAVLASQFGFTGDGTVMAALVNAPGLVPNPEPIKCNTCHVTHKPQELRVDATWNPATIVGAPAPAPGPDGKVLDNTVNAQYRLCTQCHTYINPAGKLAASGTTASGTVKVGQHETKWYRAIATTHYDDPTTTAIEGYRIDTTSANPCFDCHGHEAMTNTNNDPASATYIADNATKYTDWAQSAHGGRILTAKYAAASAFTTNSVVQVDAVLAATSPDPQWTGNRNTNRLCVRCHTETGFKQFLTVADVTTATQAVSRTEVLTCRGCHSNAANGVLRTLAGTKASTNYTTDLGFTPVMSNVSTGYALSYGKKPFPDVAGSNLCISCHNGRTGDPGNPVNYNRHGIALTSPTGPHDLPSAAVMYLKMGFLNLSTGSTGTPTADYLNSLKSDQDGGSVTSTHRKLGTPAIIGDTHTNKDGVATFATAASAGKLASNGPCATCHLTGSHSLEIDQRAITAVCNRCHVSEGGSDVTTIAAFRQYFLEPQQTVFLNAIDLAFKIFNNKSGQTTITYAKSTSGAWSAYSRTTTSGSGAALRPVYTNTNYAAYLAGTGNQPASATTADWAAAVAAYNNNQTKLFGAIGNLRLFFADQGSFAHARTYTRRLLYDSIDYLDDGVLNMSVGMTAVALDPVTYVKGPTPTTGGTTESMTYLLKVDRASGAWSSTQRP